MSLKNVLYFKKGTSLRKDFMFSLLFAMIIPALFISLSVDYYFVYSQNMKALRGGAEGTMDRAVSTLSKALWQYNVEFLQVYADVLIADNNLSSITIFDERGRAVAGASQDQSRVSESGVTWELKREVTLEGKKVGGVVATFNNSEIRKLSVPMLITDVLVILAILLSVWAVTWVLVTRYVLQPLRIMQDGIHGISKGDYSKRVVLENNNELTTIAREFNIMVGEVETRDKALRESEVKYRNLVESSSDIIFTMDDDNNIVFINENFEKWTGLDRERLLGEPFSEMFEKCEGIESSDLFLTRGEDDGLWERELIKSDGTSIPVELNFSIQYNDKNRSYGAIGIARNISNRRQAEEELRKYEQMVASITDYLLLIDKDYTIQAVNVAYLDSVDKKRSQLIGHPVQSIFAKQSYEEDFLPYFTTCLEGTSVKHQKQLFLDNAEPMYMVITFYPLVVEGGNVSGGIVHMRDITEQKKLEAMLNQSQKMEAIGTLAGGIAHDFNNIIGGIVGYAEMIEMFDAKDSAKLETRIQHVLKGAYRARELVEQILTFSRNTDSRKKPLHLDNLVNDTLQFLRASLPSTVQIVKPEKCPNSVVWANETSVQQVLMNLCTNAAHAMQEKGGKLTVALCIEKVDMQVAERIHVPLPGSYVKLSVTDTGVGMEPLVQERIFEPFYTTKEIGEGTGMGLAMVHGIVKELHGSIMAESTPGVGSLFHVYLPQYDLGDTLGEEKEVRHEKVRVGQGRILIVDDEEELLGFSSDILEHLGYEVLATTSSIEARQVFLNDPMAFDLVITDQTMPNITGVELARQFLDARDDIKIILCTGYSKAVTQEEIKEVGISRFVKKPFGARQLVDMVSSELDRGRVAIQNELS